jgi:beta-glucosidase-like glycosyl hydrolase
MKFRMPTIAIMMPANATHPSPSYQSPPELDETLREDWGVDGAS